MHDDQAPKIVIIGCGNVAWHLARKFTELKFSVNVYNHRANPVLENFRRSFKTSVHIGLHNIARDASFYFICVPDRHIAACAKKVHPLSPRAVVVHTSGSAEIEELGTRGHGTAVFYPLQTFSRSDDLLWRDVPVIIEGDSEPTTEQVLKLASHISNSVLVISYEERLKLHLAAVLVNNFTNALYAEAFKLLGSSAGGRRFDLLLPLARQTVEKVKNIDPRAAQTGPAKRGDKKVMKKHLRLLDGNSELKKLYKQLSTLIVSQQQP